MIKNKPYEDILRNKLEIYNEGCVMLLTMSMGLYMIEDL
jgi:hypothetical protein